MTEREVEREAERKKDERFLIEMRRVQELRSHFGMSQVEVLDRLDDDEVVRLLENDESINMNEFNRNDGTIDFDGTFAHDGFAKRRAFRGGQGYEKVGQHVV